MWLYPATIFLSAFLLFQVQLAIAKYILPWHGGVPAVWTTCLLFFQCALLLGYAYAHWLAGRGPAIQRATHVVLLAAGVAALVAGAHAWGAPLLPDDRWRPQGGGDPVWQIVRLLTVSVALPFVTLSATAPLLQHWFSREGQRAPYRLYAVSNLGSLAGLLGYPFLVEVFVPLRAQAWLWAAGYALFAFGVVAVALRPEDRSGPRPDAGTAADGTSGPRPTPGQFALWFGLAACASVLLLAVTNQVSQEIAPVPLLWVLPLALYLLSFVLCFESDRWYARDAYLVLLVAAVALATLSIQHGVSGGLLPQVLLWMAVLFVACMVCHGELARQRPAPRHLTAFYLTLTAGGAAGGLFVGLAAPRLFDGYWELSLGLWGSAALALVVLARDRASWLHRGRAAPAIATFAVVLLLLALVFADSLRATVLALAVLDTRALVVLLGVSAALLAAFRPRAHGAASCGAFATRISLWRETALRTPQAGIAILAGALVLLGAIHVVFARDAYQGSVAVARNFFGVLRATLQDDEAAGVVLNLQHGRTLHGQQFLAEDRRLRPNGYYEADSGVGRALLGHARRRAGTPMRIGVVGLGTGTLAAYGRAGDRFRFYEINPAVIALAQGERALFSYLRETPAEVSVVTGDARVSLERELARGEPGEYDVFALDAFNSDSIPVHLLTREAFSVYLAHLAADGVLAVHVSNRYLDLEPLLARLAHEQTLAAVTVETPPDETGRWESRWVLLARRAELLPADVPPARLQTDVPAWTDDHSNLLAVFSLAPGEPAGGDGAPRTVPTTVLDLER